MLANRIKSLAPAPAPKEELKGDQAAIQQELNKLKEAEKNAATLAQFNSCHIQAKLLETKTRRLLSQEKAKLPASCDKAIYYSNAMRQMTNIELESQRRGATPSFNVKLDEYRNLLINKAVGVNKEHTAILERCSKASTLPKPK